MTGTWTTEGKGGNMNAMTWSSWYDDWGAYPELNFAGKGGKSDIKGKGNGKGFEGY